MEKSYVETQQGGSPSPMIYHRPQMLQITAIALGGPPELEGKTVLVKILHA